ncbi:Heparinase II/III-like protein [Lutibacter agarilyticus]|uniref:Heparinase II/III-like protein n=1 Tax=Lutibacter agarilyticus TaxID=1109740 RepID=A0A238YJD1_9FLAO|nr:heparinase II/III family protein [Lutibacter agarilyticus]SNR70821.1 Heparinase II/III-like protein [Lutibacter agarilyticus]
MTKLSAYIVSLFLFLNTLSLVAQKIERPFIWVEHKDRVEILAKIENEAWAKQFYNNFKQRLDTDIILYKQSPKEFIAKLPFDWSKQEVEKTPPLKTYNNFTESNSSDRFILNKYLQIGVDCSVLYFLTEDENYAQCAAAILHAFVEGVLQLTPSKELGNGGWIYPTDYLREARVFGAQVPIIYDFIALYLEKNNKVYDIGKNDFTKFSEENAQKVFLTYANLAAYHGHRGSNWSVLMSFSLVQNALALNNLEERKKYVDFYLEEGTSKQDALPDISANYKKEGDVYPETSQYSNGVAAYTTRMLLILNKYNPSLKLGQKYYKIPFSLDRWNKLHYPNNEIIRFGDGHRKFGVQYASYDMAYLLGEQDGVGKLTNKFGPLITKSIQEGKYDRANVGKRSDGASVYFTPTQLLWLHKTKEYSVENTVLPRTDDFSHAGVFLQRNLSSTNNPDDGLMCFVGGAHMVHGHASGMDMELYGLGEVLGVDHGRGQYRTDLHENYSRLFAAHNSVIVNGASQGEGDWVNLGMNTVELVTMEPMPLEKAISPNHSFTRTRFLDDKGDKAEATQERTLALIRTSPTTGYYVDVFRSKSALPNEYHDYLYHNIGDELNFLNKDLDLKSDENRFNANANDKHIRNRKYRNPGWHFFKEVKSSSIYEADIKAQFELNKLSKKSYMNVFVVGNKNREYTKVMAPKTFEAPVAYENLPTPTLVIRQKGEAWTNPFAVIYEPSFDENSKNGIQSVTKLENNGVFKGFKVVSKIESKICTQYIINQNQKGVYEHKELEISFKGAFAVLTFDKNNKLQNSYIGEGDSLTVGQVQMQSKNMQPIAAYIEFLNEDYKINATENTEFNINN